MIFQQKWMGQIKSARASAEGAFSIKPREQVGSLAMTLALEHLAQEELNAIEVSKPLKTTDGKMLVTIYTKTKVFN